MNRNNRHNKHRNWNNQKNSGNGNNSKEGLKNQPEKNQFQHIPSENLEALKKKEEAIQALKAREIICPLCNKPVSEISSAIQDKTSGNPVHFECVMEKLTQSEPVGQNEKICYIGQGRFGILYFENPRDQRHFTIKKIIEWESRETKSDWREEVSSLFSQVE